MKKKLSIQPKTLGPSKKYIGRERAKRELGKSGLQKDIAQDHTEVTTDRGGTGSQKKRV